MSFLSALFPPTITPQEAHEALRRREVVVLDVRERREWKAGHIAGSRNVPLGSLGTPPEGLAGRRTVTVCKSGARSRSAAARLRRAGIDVVNLRGGMLAWQRAGLPLDRRGGRVA